MRHIKSIIICLLFPLYSLFSSKIAFTIIFPTLSGWFAYTRGKLFSIKKVGLEGLEYYRYFVPNTGGIVFDVGGELGIETVQFSRMVGESGKVFVFECFPAHVERLRRIAKDRGNIAVIENACWNLKTSLTFYQGHTPGSNTAIPDATGQVGQALANTSADKFIVAADTLDSLWDKLTGKKVIEFLKMDIEGAELEALEGASELLKNTKKVVIAAYHIRGGKPTAEKVKEFLIPAGFKVKIDENLHVYGYR
ncbi:MAG: hypothetical protein ACD_20C00178G0002 [uncultured bacterium]|nr:MAG: hypothetical protein ACD_20C00178G0002 [uncultured bacterium]